MKCQKCKTTLSPFLLQQVHKQRDQLFFEIECPNPFCRERNLVSKSFYFSIKKDFEKKYYFRKKLKITNKLPGEANVMFVSLERCGISWIVRRLSKLHEIMFHKPIEYIPEISRVISTRKRFPLPKGWYNVYSVDPQKLLDRGYDKVVSIQRPLNVMYRVMAMYYMPELTYEECREEDPDYFKRIDRYYDLVYSKIDEIDDPRYKNFTLPDFNNYTVATFHELMDFLNFPKTNRPLIVPVNPPERNWQAYSTTLNKEEEIGAKLRMMQKKYGDGGILEYDLQKQKENKALIKKRQEAKLMNTIKQNAKKKKIPKLLPIESRIQDSRKFRMYRGGEEIPDALEKDTSYKIVIITPTGFGLGCHMGENLTTAFEELGHTVIQISFSDIKKQRLHGKKEIKLSKLLRTFIPSCLKYKNRPDFIIINQMRMGVINYDLEAHEIPVFYFHTGWYQDLKVKGKFIVNYFRHDRLTEVYNRVYSGKVNRTLYHAIDPKVFYPLKEKSIKGVCGIGYRRSWGDFKRITGDMRPFVEIMELETKQFKEQGFKYFDTPISDIEYRNVIKQIEAFNPILSFDSYVSRRTLEAMACKTLVVLRLSFSIDKKGNKDTSIHRNILKGMGYEAGRDYIEIESMYDIQERWKSLTEGDKERIRESAYLNTIANHTHRNRALQIINDFEEGIWRK